MEAIEILTNASPLPGVCHWKGIYSNRHFPSKETVDLTVCTVQCDEGLGHMGSTVY